jgi:predicted AAA+ superfamily ATPase
LRWGTLPRILTEESDQNRAEILRGYVHTYLREEILEEQLARSVRPFRRFLEVAAQTNGQILNYASVARDVGVTPNTVQSYYQILEDTLLAERLDPFHESIRKRQRSAPKIYLFDLGVQRALAGVLDETLTPGSYGFGRVFEHFIVCECMRRNSYLSKDYRFSYLRTKNDLEIDLVIERPGMPRALVEIKSTDRIQEDHYRSLQLLGNDISNSERFCLSRDPIARLVDGIKVLPWERGLTELGLGVESVR